MLEQYKNGLTLFGVLSVIAILFPPIIWETKTRILDTGFAFLFSIPKYRNSGIGGSVNFGMLFLELIIILIVSILFQLYYDKIKKALK